MTIVVEDNDARKLVRLSGELTTADDELVDLVTDLVHAQNNAIILDLDKITFINSSGLNALIRIVAEANTREQRVIFAAPTAFVDGVFQATKLDRFFEVTPSVDAAFAKLAT